MSDSIKKWEEICKEENYKNFTPPLKVVDSDYQLENLEGDALKMKNLIIDLQKLKSKYFFKSLENKIIYENVKVLIDEVQISIRKQ